MKLKSLVLALMITQMLPGCGSIPPPLMQTGQLAIRAVFPQSLSAKTIKPETQVIFVAAYGVGLPQDKPLYSQAITPASPTVVLTLPVGQQTILVAAFDAQHQILTADRKAVTIGVGRNRLETELQENFAALLSPNDISLMNQAPFPALVPPAVPTSIVPPPISSAPLTPTLHDGIQLKILNPPAQTPIALGEKVPLRINVQNRSASPIAKLLLETSPTTKTAPEVLWDTEPDAIIAEAIGNLSWIADTPGDFNLRISAKDAQNQTIGQTESFKVTVPQPIATPLPLEAPRNLQLAPVTGQPLHQNLTWEIVTNAKIYTLYRNQEKLLVDLKTPQTELDVSTWLPGTYNLTLTATDSTGRESARSSALNITIASPIAKPVVFSSTRDGNYDLYQMSPDGSNIKRLTDHAAVDTQPRWSPDGQWIVFTSYRDGNGELYLVSTESPSAPIRLTNTLANEGGAAWSPDGRSLIFHSDQNGNLDLYTMTLGIQQGQVSPGQPQQLTTSSRDESFPDWSPNGQQVVFQVVGGEPLPQLSVIKADGSELRVLTNGSHPAWSPDGQTIAYQNTASGNLDIYLIQANGQGQQRLTTDSAPDGLPAWSVDGKSLYFVSTRAGLDEIFALSLAQPNPPRRLTDNDSVDTSPHSAQ